MLVNQIRPMPLLFSGCIRFWPPKKHRELPSLAICPKNSDLRNCSHLSNQCTKPVFEGSAYLQSMDCQREPQSKHPTSENPGIYTLGVPFLVLFEKNDRAILVLATFHPPWCTVDDLALSNCRILTTKSCFKVLLFYDVKSYCHRSRAVVLYSCVMADYIASNNCKIKECFEVLLLCIHMTIPSVQ